MASCFLEPDEVEDAFLEDLMGNSPQEMQAFCDYLLENYIEEGSPFPPDMWASRKITSERTTNACESFHAKFSECFNSPHPNKYTFVESLKLFQEEVFINIRSAKDLPRKRYNRNFVRKIANIHLYIHDYVIRGQSRVEFIKNVATHYLPKA